MRFLGEGVVLVGGGAPIFSRAAAFTALEALNGLRLGNFDGTVFLRRDHWHLTSVSRAKTTSSTSPATNKNPSLATVAALVCACGRAAGWAEDGYQYE